MTKGHHHVSNMTITCKTRSDFFFGIRVSKSYRKKITKFSTILSNELVVYHTTIIVDICSNTIAIFVYRGLRIAS